MNEIKAIDKNLYKIFISILKYTPITLLILFMIGFVLNIMGISTLVITCLCGTSLMTLTLLYILSYIFKFCNLFRMPLHYVAATNIITLIVKVIGITTLNLLLLRVYLITGALILIFYIWNTYKNRNKPKNDPIKDLCKRYCG